MWSASTFSPTSRMASTGRNCKCRCGCNAPLSGPELKNANCLFQVSSSTFSFHCDVILHYPVLCASCSQALKQAYLTSKSSFSSRSICAFPSLGSADEMVWDDGVLLKTRRWVGRTGEVFVLELFRVPAVLSPPGFPQSTDQTKGSQTDPALILCPVWTLIRRCHHCYYCWPWASLQEQDSIGVGTERFSSQNC